MYLPVRSSPDGHPAFLPEPGKELVEIRVKLNFHGFELRSKLQLQSVPVPRRAQLVDQIGQRCVEGEPPSGR